MRGGPLQRVGSVPGPVDDVSGPVEVSGHHLGDGRIVVDDEDPGPGPRVLLLFHAASVAPPARGWCPPPLTSLFRKEPQSGMPVSRS